MSMITGGSEIVRRPTWSRYLTGPMAAVIPPRRRTQALIAIKAVHTAIFVSVVAALVVRAVLRR